VLAGDGAEHPDVRAGSSAEHLQRLAQLVEQQADELCAAEAGWREITALCDLAEWAAESAGNGAAPVVLVGDLRRILAGRRGGPASDTPA
jgi:hypothetical protein